MSEKMTPGMRAQVLRLVAPYLVNDMLFRAQAEADRIEAEAFRDEAARREAGDRDVSIPSLGPTEDAPPAADLVARLLSFHAEIVRADGGRESEQMRMTREAAAAIEALRAERDAVLSLIPPEFLDPPDGGEVKPVELVRRVVARVKALEGAALRLANAADAVGVNHFDTDTFDQEVLEMQHATIAVRQALAAGGADA